MEWKSESMEDSSSLLVPTMLDPSCVMWSNKNGMSKSTIDDSIPPTIPLFLSLRLGRNFRILNWDRIGQYLPFNQSVYLQYAETLDSSVRCDYFSIARLWLNDPTACVYLKLSTIVQSSTTNRLSELFLFMPKSFVEWSLLLLWILFVMMWCVMKNADTSMNREICNFIAMTGSSNVSLRIRVHHFSAPSNLSWNTP